jgi:hypothetical protein
VVILGGVFDHFFFTELGHKKFEFDNLLTNKVLLESLDPIYCVKKCFLAIEITW